MQSTEKYSVCLSCSPVTRVSPVAEAPQDILIARPEARRTMGLPDLVLPINLTFLVWVCVLPPSFFEKCTAKYRSVILSSALVRNPSMLCLPWSLIPLRSSLVVSLQGDLVSKHPVNSLTVAQAVAEHEQLLGQLKVKFRPSKACYHQSVLFIACGACH